MSSSCSNISDYIDFVSDIHIDQWDKTIGVKYACGEIKDCPMNWKNIPNKSNILVIAGDISDDLDNTLKYLSYVSQYYNKILFVDGNHEHVNKFPELYELNFINKKVSEYNKLLGSDKIIYLPNNDYILDSCECDDTVFIGYCGWWDYCNLDNKTINDNLSYFSKWIPGLTKGDGMEFIKNVSSRAKIEKDLLMDKIMKYEKDSKIKKIIIVTHSPPIKEFCDIKKLGSEYNSGFEDIVNNVKNGKFKKLRLWLSGHVHTKNYDIYHNLEFINHPRGRPDDHNREEYSILKLKI